MKRCNASTSTDGHGGSRPINPPGVPLVTAHEVKALAHQNLVALRRIGRLWQWWNGETWVNGYQTNWLMLEWLKGKP